jgi:hypothetical protein
MPDEFRLSSRTQDIKFLAAMLSLVPAHIDDNDLQDFLQALVELKQTVQVCMLGLK